MKFSLTMLIGVMFFALTGCNDGAAISQNMPTIQEPLSKKDLDVDNSAEYEKSVFEIVNQYRQQRGLTALELNAEVSEIARNHSENMAKKLSQWGHDGYEERVKMVAVLLHWEEIGENLARTRDENSPIQALLGWINSPLHEDNLSGDFNLTGIGVARSPSGEYYITQIFIRT